MNGVGVFFPPGEDTVRKMAVCNPEEVLARTCPCSHLDLKLLVSRTVSKQTSVVWAAQSVGLRYSSLNKLLQRGNQI